MTEHNPLRPDWTCTWCLGEWPCHTRRRELLAEYDGTLVSLSIYLAGQFVRAAADLDYVPAGWLHNRFLGWIRHPEEPLPYSALDVLLSSYYLAKEHTPDEQGRCPVCGDPDACWVRLDPNEPAILLPQRS